MKKVADLPVMKSHCKSCPFKPNKFGHPQNQELANVVTVRTLFNAQQVCHGTEGKSRIAKNRCKGSYDYNKEIYNRLGWLNEETLKLLN